MSWDKFTKGTQQLKTPVISKTEGKEFQREAKNLEALDDLTKLLIKDTKALNESEIALVKVEQKLVSDLNASQVLVKDVDFKAGLCEWAENSRANEDACSGMVSSTQKVLVDPLKRLNNIFPAIQEGIRKRERLLLEYHKWHQKYEKYQKKERIGPNVVKLDTYRKNLASSRAEYEAHSVLLMQEMPRLYESKAAYLQPSVRALINLQLQNSGQCYKSYTELLNTMCPSSETQINHQDLINEIKGLSIVAD